MVAGLTILIILVVVGMIAWAYIGYRQHDKIWDRCFAKMHQAAEQTPPLLSAYFGGETEAFDRLWNTIKDAHSFTANRMVLRAIGEEFDKIRKDIKEEK